VLCCASIGVVTGREGGRVAPVVKRLKYSARVIRKHRPVKKALYEANKGL